MKKIIFPIILSFLFLNSRAQTPMQPLKIGDSLPDMVLDHFISSEKQQVPIRSYRGKLLILDFGVSGAHPALKGCRKLERLSKAHKKDVMIIAVTSNTRASVLKKLRETPSLAGLQLPVITDDHKLRALFPYTLVPNDVIIDRNGKVLAITDGNEINEKTIDSLLAHKNVRLAEKKYFGRFDYDKPLFIEDKGEQLLYHFMVTAYVNGLQSRMGLDGDFVADSLTRIYATNYAVVDLLLNYNGQRIGLVPIPDRQVILHVRDSTRFKKPLNLTPFASQQWDQAHTYCVDFMVPPAMHKQIFQRFKTELDHFFDINSSMRIRTVPALVLTRLDSAGTHLTKATPVLDKSVHMWHVINVPIDVFVSTVNDKSPIAIVDETYYHGKLNLRFVPDFSNEANVQKALEKAGFTVEKSYRDLWYIEIDDKGSTYNQ